MSRVSRRALLLGVGLGLLCGLVFFARPGGSGLFDLDEGLYAEAAREMRLSGDLVTPRVNGEPFFEKPPLIYWLAAASYSLIGRSELSTRLPSALASTLLAFLVYGFGTRTFGRRAGFLAAAFFVLSPLVFAEARLLTTDAVLDFCIAAALFAYWRGEGVASRKSQVASQDYGYGIQYAEAGVDPQPSTLNPQPASALFWLLSALGVLAKGLPGLLIPVAVVVVYRLFVDRFRLREVGRGLWRLRPLTGLLLFLAVAAPWHVLAWRQSGEAFTQEYVIRQHIGRFRGGDTAHRAPFWVYAPGFLLLAFPWSLCAVAAVAGRSNSPRRHKGHEEQKEDSGFGSQDSRAGAQPCALRLAPCDSAPQPSTLNPQPASVPPSPILFLTVWAALIFLMFSASGSKLPSYILPMFPPAALLAGDWCARVMEGREARRALLGMAGGAFALALLLWGVALFHEPILRLVEARSGRPVNREEVPPEVLAFAARLFGALALATGAWWGLLLAERRRAAFGALLVGMALFFAVAVFDGLPAVDRAFNRPLQSLAREAGRQATATGAPLAIWVGPPRRPSVLFYLPDALFRDPPEGGQHVFETKEAASLRAYLAGRPGALVLTEAKRTAELPAARPIARAGKWVLLRASE